MGKRKSYFRIMVTPPTNISGFTATNYSDFIVEIQRYHQGNYLIFDTTESTNVRVFPLEGKSLFDLQAGGEEDNRGKKELQLKVDFKVKGQKLADSKYTMLLSRVDGIESDVWYLDDNANLIRAALSIPLNVSEKEEGNEHMLYTIVGETLGERSEISYRKKFANALPLNPKGGYNTPYLLTDTATVGAYPYLSFNAIINTYGLNATISFECGTDTTYSDYTGGDSTVVNTNVDTDYSYPVFDFVDQAPETTYHYRVKAVIGGNTYYGQDKTFTTLADLN
jgi:hypothetical protein